MSGKLESQPDKDKSSEVAGNFNIYWEQQESGFCGVHCVNNLLQGPCFTEVDLSEIGHALDAAERALMMEMGTDTTDFLKYMAQDSESVDQGGHFSIQVLRNALELYNVSIDSVNSENSKKILVDPVNLAEGFVCNLRNHWFALRKLNGIWFNLNSLYEAPRLITPFFLSAYLDQLRAEGYQIFVTQGVLPPALEDNGNGIRGQWLPAQPIIDRKGKPGPSNKKDEVEEVEDDSDSEESILQRALNLSRGRGKGRSGNRSSGFKSNQGQGQGQGQGQRGQEGNNNNRGGGNTRSGNNSGNNRGNNGGNNRGNNRGPSDLERALELSQKELQGALGSMSGNNNDGKTDLERALELSKREAERDARKRKELDDDAEQERLAIAMSLSHQ